MRTKTFNMKKVFKKTVHTVLLTKDQGLNAK